MKLKETVRWRDVSAGNVQKVSSDITIPNSVPFSMNMLFERVLGEAESRQGTGLVGTCSAGNACQGLFQHLDSSVANNILFAGFNGTIFNGVSGASLLGGLSITADMNFATFLNTTLFLNGLSAQSYNAGSFVSSGGNLDVGNVPSGGKFPTSRLPPEETKLPAL